MGINVQGNAYDTTTKDSTKEMRDVARVRILNWKMININIGITSVKARMP